MYVIIIITAQKPAENRETGGPRLENDLSSRMEIRGEVISLEEETKKRERTEIILTLLHMREGVHAKLLLHWYREVGEKLITRQGGGGECVRHTHVEDRKQQSEIFGFQIKVHIMQSREM